MKLRITSMSHNEADEAERAVMHIHTHTSAVCVCRSHCGPLQRGGWVGFQI